MAVAYFIPKKIKEEGLSHKKIAVVIICFVYSVHENIIVFLLTK